jgi:hypothetical protein
MTSWTGFIRLFPHDDLPAALSVSVAAPRPRSDTQAVCNFLGQCSSVALYLCNTICTQDQRIVQLLKSYPDPRHYHYIIEYPSQQSPVNLLPPTAWNMSGSPYITIERVRALGGLLSWLGASKCILVWPPPVQAPQSVIGQPALQ